MAGKPQKNLAYSVLLDFYGPVLTDKQRVILTEYYDEDLSLATPRCGPIWIVCGCS